MLIKRDKLPEKVTRVEPENGRLILLRGEATGHHHSFVAEPEVEGWNDGEKLYIELKKKSTLEHQEHGPIVVEPGIYEMAEQVEDDGLEDARAVAD